MSKHITNKEFKEIIISVFLWYKRDDFNERLLCEIEGFLWRMSEDKEATEGYRELCIRRANEIHATLEKIGYYD